MEGARLRASARPIAILTALAAGAAIAAPAAAKITRISPSRLACDAPKGATAGPAAAAASIRCVRRTGKRLPRSVVRKDFPRFSAQAASDPRVRLSGGRRTVPPAAGRPAGTGRFHSARGGSQSPSREPVSPVLECISRDGLFYVAHFGYHNKNASRVEIAIGNSNKFTPGGNLGQPTLFSAGRLVDVFQVPFLSGNLVWTLDGRTATASPKSKACPSTPVAPLFADQVAVVPMDETGGGAEYQALRTMGVPALIAPTIADAVRYRIVILAGGRPAGGMPVDDIARLTSHVATGGVVIGESLTDPLLLPVFGLLAASPATGRSAIDWVANDATIADLDRDSERHVDIDDRFGSTFATVGYTPLPLTEVLARFDDGTAAVTRLRGATGGAAYALGGRLTDLVTRHHEGARWSARARYENTFDTSADGWLLWLRGVYRTHVAGGVTMSTAPDGKRFAVLPTLSLNFSAGVGPTLDYVREAHDRRISPTVFVWTKVTTDWLDVAFFSDSGPFDDVMRSIKAKGAEIAGHTVAHSPVFHKLPMGTGTESAPAYRPEVHSKTSTTGATVLGEIRVSRQLIQAKLNPTATSFRAGYMLTTPRLAVAEEAAGIRDDSSSTQGWVGGAFPFSIPRFDGTGYADVTTYPVVIEDERGTRIDQRIDEARELMEANGDNGAPSTILFHPNGWEWKLRAWDKLLMYIPSDAWTGTMRQFGDFWQDRSRAALVTGPSTKCAEGRRVEISSLNAAWPVRGQVLDVADEDLDELKLTTGQVLQANSDGKIELPDITGGATIAGDLCD